MHYLTEWKITQQGPDQGYFSSLYRQLKSCWGEEFKDEPRHTLEGCPKSLLTISPIFLEQEGKCWRVILQNSDRKQKRLAQSILEYFVIHTHSLGSEAYLCTVRVEEGGFSGILSCSCMHSLIHTWIICHSWKVYLLQLPSCSKGRTAGVDVEQIFQCLSFSCMNSILNT